MSKSIAIAGMGWLGLPFSQHLMTLGYLVKGSVTTPEKAQKLQKNGFNVYPVEISEAGITGEIEPLLDKVEYLVIMIPPGLRRNTGANFVLKMTRLLNEVEKYSVQKVILISSTSVYADDQGNVTERDLPKPETNSGKQLFEVEQLFFNAPFIKTTIVRFGGLFGGSRQPARYLAGRENLLDGNAPVNLIHREDCIAILSEIIKKDRFGYIFNAVLPQHPTKAEYYTKKAKHLNLIPPTFSKTEKNEVFKQVDSENINLHLDYSFKNPL